ncbi:hypothetical protein MferCBS31731_002461 [Microsporum ferrugineum]
MDDDYLAAPVPPPAIEILGSSSMVDVRVVIPILFWQPKIEGFSGFHVPSFCFLVSSGSQHVVFGLGICPDWRKYAPKVVSIIEETTVITPGSDVASVLESDSSGLNIRREEISFDDGLEIGRFRAMDFFGDGSFYLLYAPGHAEGRLCALARTTADPCTYGRRRLSPSRRSPAIETVGL